MRRIYTLSKAQNAVVPLCLAGMRKNGKGKGKKVERVFSRQEKL